MNRSVRWRNVRNEQDLGTAFPFRIVQPPHQDIDFEPCEHEPTNDLTLESGESIAVLEGQTYSGITIHVEDSIRIVSP